MSVQDFHKEWKLGQTICYQENEEIIQDRMRFAEAYAAHEREKVDENGWIEYDGAIIVYEYRVAKKGEECLGTKNPKEYCNGFYSYSPKDPGNGMAYVVLGRIYRQPY